MNRGSQDDGYAATTGADQLGGPFRAAPIAAIEPFLEASRPDLGPVLDIETDRADGTGYWIFRR